MLRIGLLSDTHGWWDDRYKTYFEECDEIWHAGDIGDASVADRLEALKPCRMVCGNIDGQDLRLRYPKDQRFTLEGVSVWMTHIGGYPGRYSADVYARLSRNAPQLFVCGHSHICKVMFDQRLNMLVVNPGAAGTYGQQVVRTMIRFTLDAGQIRDMEVIELGPGKF